MGNLRDQLWPVFIEEVGEQIDQLEMLLDPSRAGGGDVNALFRHFHTIKSSGSMMDFQSIEKLAHASEDMLFVLRENNLPVDGTSSRLLVRALDVLKQQLNHVTRFRDNPPQDEQLVADLIRHGELAKAPEADLQSGASDKQTDIVTTADSDDATMRINSTTLDDLVSSVGNMAMRENMFSHVLRDETVTALAQRVRSSLPNLQAGVLPEVDRLMTLDLLSALDDSFARVIHADQSIQTALTVIEQDVLDLRVVPIAVVFNRLPLLVKKTGENSGKQVELLMHGAEVRIDKRMVDTLMEPLVHIIRNAIDHGIEPADLRQQQGKDEVGVITVKAEHDAGMLVLEIADDGKGLDNDRIVAKARANGLVSADHVFASAEQIHQLIFLPGFSTTDTVTETSGRGVGMDIVKTKIAGLGGRVELLSSPGKGTRFRLHLPLSVAMQSVLLLRWQQQVYALALRHVSEIIPYSPRSLQNTCGQSVLLFRDDVLPVTSLGQLMGFPHASTTASTTTSTTTTKTQGEIVIIRRQDEWLGILVDQVLGQQELIVREVHSDLSKLPGFGGVSLLADGRVVIIVDSDHVFKLSSTQARQIAAPASEFNEVLV